MKNEQEKSDPSIVAKRPANKPQILEVDLWRSGAESAEPREGTKGNTGEQHTRRTPSRESVSQGLERVREAAKQRKKERFTALLHHVTIDLLKDAYSWLKREAAPGVDGRTWQSYKQNLEANLVELHSRIHRGTYRALPSRRRYIPKPDGRQRPLGIAALEDKIVQRAVVEVLNAIYEEDFLGFSYGFRPGRGQHDALDALAVGITRTKVNWIVDADITGFFDAVSHEWLMRFVEHRIGDRRINRLIRKWLKAGVMEEGELVSTETGTPQGQLPRRCWPISTSITSSTSGQTDGESATPEARSSSCATPMTSSWVSSTKVKPDASWQICGSGWKSSRYRCIRTRHV